MYVGGNFTGVKRVRTARKSLQWPRRIRRDDGEWNGQTFSFNNQVKDLLSWAGRQAARRL